VNGTLIAVAFVSSCGIRRAVGTNPNSLVHKTRWSPYVVSRFLFLLRRDYLPTPEGPCTDLDMRLILQAACCSVTVSR